MRSPPREALGRCSFITLTALSLPKTPFLPAPFLPLVARPSHSLLPARGAQRDCPREPSCCHRGLRRACRALQEAWSISDAALRLMVTASRRPALGGGHSEDGSVGVVLRPASQLLESMISEPFPRLLHSSFYDTPTSILKVFRIQHFIRRLPGPLFIYVTDPGAEIQGSVWVPPSGMPFALRNIKFGVAEGGWGIERCPVTLHMLLLHSQSP